MTVQYDSGMEIIQTAVVDSVEIGRIMVWLRR